MNDLATSRPGRLGLWWIIISTLLVGGAAALWSAQQPTTHKSSVSFAVNRINKQETADYQYDGYYAIQASDLFSQTVVSWFFTPSFLLEIYDQAGVTPTITSLEAFTGQFHTKKYSAQNIVVTFAERDRATAQRISEAIILKVRERSAQLNQTADRKALFEVVGSTPVIVEQKPNIPLKTVLGLVAGCLIGIGLVYGRRYLKAAPAA